MAIGDDARRERSDEMHEAKRRSEVSIGACSTGYPHAKGCKGVKAKSGEKLKRMQVQTEEIPGPTGLPDRSDHHRPVGTTGRTQCQNSLLARDRSARLVYSPAGYAQSSLFIGDRSDRPVGSLARKLQSSLFFGDRSMSQQTGLADRSDQFWTKGQQFMRAFFLGACGFKCCF